PSAIWASSSMMRIFGNLITSRVKAQIRTPLFGFAGREQQREAAALPRRALQQHAPAMCLDNVFDQCEAQASAFCIVHQTGAHAIEFLEDLFVFRARDADATVGDLDGNVSILRAHT